VNDMVRRFEMLVRRFGLGLGDLVLAHGAAAP